MNPMTWMIFISTLSTSTVIVMSCNHWLLAWMGLELNTLSILPIIMKPHHPRATEATTKYFLIQTTASTLILFASTLNAWQSGNWTITLSSSTTSDMIILSALLLKMGEAPAHLWYPDVIQGPNMLTALTISTWQKLAPLTLLYTTINHISTTALMLTGLLSVLVGGWGGLNQTQTRKILAFSSIAHMGWLLIALTMNLHLATITMIVYLLMTTTMFLTLANSTSKTLQSLGSAWAYSPPLLASTTTTLLSLGGLPPLTGFMPKLLILKELTLNNLTFTATTLALMGLPSLYFYTRMAYITNLTTPPNTYNTQHKWRLKTTKKLNPAMIVPLTVLALPVTPLLYAHT
uniref:NADH-ubiquinone oxidoreductase chain 2 n=1 Tax=Pachydactylus latirostris TaxID=1211946 RepID=J7FGZ1_9SAUR|nr:NADH dehydrogenase subunit 2 [Pachydactylus mariquensis latirostris]